jgi:hypothetical protein
LYFSANIIIQLIKSKKMRWSGLLARMVEERNAFRVLVQKPEGKRHLEVPGTDGRIIFKWILRKKDGRA